MSNRTTSAAFQPQLLPEGYQPTKVDVICGGRGKVNSHCPGNRQFTQILCANLQQYINAPKRVDKSAVISSILDTIFETGAKFIKLDKQTRRYSELSSNQIYYKTSHAIRGLLKGVGGGNSKSTNTAAEDDHHPTQQKVQSLSSSRKFSPGERPARRSSSASSAGIATSASVVALMMGLSPMMNKDKDPNETSYHSPSPSLSPSNNPTSVQQQSFPPNYNNMFSASVASAAADAQTTTTTTPRSGPPGLNIIVLTAQKTNVEQYQQHSWQYPPQSGNSSDVNVPEPSIWGGGGLYSSGRSGHTTSTTSTAALDPAVMMMMMMGGTNVPQLPFRSEEGSASIHNSTQGGGFGTGISHLLPAVVDRQDVLAQRGGGEERLL